MVRFRQKLDKNKKIYIPKPLRESGFKDTIEIRPNTHAAVMYPQGASINNVIKSLEIIIRDLQLQLETEREEDE